jgi:hypothetical protein
MSHETVLLKTTNLLYRTSSDGVTMYEYQASVDVDLRSVDDNRYNEYIQYVFNISDTAHVRCSNTTEPFTLRRSRTLDVAHGIEHIAVVRMLTQFRTGKGNTVEWATQNSLNKAMSTITLDAFEPFGIVFKANEKTLRGDIVWAIADVNEFFRSAS